MNYITQYISESQLRYSNIFPKPIDVLSHMLFTNGNGVDFVNGNPVEGLSFGKYVPFVHYYAVCSSYDDLAEEYVSYYLDADVNKHAKQLTDVYGRFEKDSPLYKSTDQIYQECFATAYEELNAIQVIDFSQMDSIDYWVKQIENNKYYPSLHLSTGYFKLEQINENTEPQLFKLASIIVSAYIQFYENMLRDTSKILAYEYPFGSAFSKMNEHIDESIEYTKNDLRILNDELFRLAQIGEMHEN